MRTGQCGQREDPRQCHVLEAKKEESHGAQGGGKRATVAPGQRRELAQGVPEAAVGLGEPSPCRAGAEALGMVGSRGQCCLLRSFP